MKFTIKHLLVVTYTIAMWTFVLSEMWPVDLDELRAGYWYCRNGRQWDVTPVNVLQFIAGLLGCIIMNVLVWRSMLTTK